MTVSRQARLRGATGKRGRHFYKVVAAGLVAMIPLILFSTLWLRSEFRRSQRDVESFLANRAAAISQRIDAEIGPSLAALNVLSLLPDDDGDALRVAASGLIGASSHWMGVRLVEGGTGRSLMAVPDDAGMADAAMLRRVGEDGQPAVTVQDRPGGGTTISLYGPVRRGGAVPRILVATLGVEDLQTIVASNKSRGILSVIVDGNSRILSSASADGEASPAQPARLAASFAGQDAGLFTAAAPDGRSLTYAFSRSPLTGWISVVSMDRRQLEQMSTKSIWTTIAAGAISLVLAVILILFIVHTVLERRVNEERLAASEALGELDARLLAATQEALNDQKKASSEREILLREIYHRVKNNLQIVQSLLRLGSRDLKAEQREPFESAVRRIGAMARVHTLLYKSPDLASIDFKDYLDELLRELSDSYAGEDRRIEHSLEAPSTMVPLDTAVPLAFIAVEILTNSFRHAFPDGRSGRISVEIAHDEPFGVLRFRDDGVGFSPDLTKRRLGLTIVRKLIQQIGGSLVEPGAGSSEFVVRFPLQSPGGPPQTTSREMRAAA